LARTTVLITLVLGALALALPAGASAVPEAGDAGELPGAAQDLSTQAVDAVEGTLATGSDRDLYRVCLTGGGSFSASTIGGSAIDTQLFLFDDEGLGVYADDDAGGTRQSALPAEDPLTPGEAGFYLLAVTPYNQDPLSALGRIFPDRGSLTGSSGPGAGAPLDAWGGSAGGSGAYTVSLSGTAACLPPDTTPPTVDLRSPSDGQGVPVGEAVIVDFSCADDRELVSCEGTAPDGATLDTATPGDRPVTVTAVDAAGNRTSVTHTLTVGDVTPPTIDLRSPLDGAVFLLGEEVAADYSCADETGLAACEGSVPDGDPVDTGSVGQRTFTVTATDLAGGTATQTSAYRVVYDFQGFRWPTRDRPEVNRVRAGRVVRVRFSLDGFHGRDVLADGFPQVAETQCGSGEEPASGAAARLVGRHRVRYRRWWWRSYWLLWKTERSWAGSCRQLLVGLADGTVHRVDYRFKP